MFSGNQLLCSIMRFSVSICNAIAFYRTILCNSLIHHKIAPFRMFFFLSRRLGAAACWKELGAVRVYVKSIYVATKKGEEKKLGNVFYRSREESNPRRLSGCAVANVWGVHSLLQSVLPHTTRHVHHLFLSSCVFLCPFRERKFKLSAKFWSNQ